MERALAGLFTVAKRLMRGPSDLNQDLIGVFGFFSVIRTGLHDVDDASAQLAKTCGTVRFAVPPTGLRFRVLFFYQCSMQLLRLGGI